MYFSYGYKWTHSFWNGIIIGRTLYKLAIDRFFILNLVITALELYRYEKKDEVIHWGCFISIAVMYTTVLYGDMLHRMNSVQEVIESLAIRTFVVLAAVGISLAAAKIIKEKANRNRTIYEDE